MTMRADWWHIRFSTYPARVVWAEYIREMTEVIRKRGETASSIEGVVREFEQKRRAIERRNPLADGQSFDDALQEHLDRRYFELYQREARKRYLRFVSVRADHAYKQNLALLNSIEDPVLRLGMRLANMFERQDTLRQAAELVGS